MALRATTHVMKMAGRFRASSDLFSPQWRRQSAWREVSSLLGMRTAVSTPASMRTLGRSSLLAVCCISQSEAGAPRAVNPNKLC
jgi:hypothetical protein